MKPVKLIAVFSENKPGQLARITKVLADENINIRWVTFATSETFGVIKLLVDKTDPAFRALRQQGWTVSRAAVLAVEVPDRPGGLHAVAECLTQHGINIENSSGFVSHNRAVLLLEVDELARARRILKSEKLDLLSQEEMMRL
jgi:hypothetical protein